ncbi:MAG: M14 family zinc carboxypeptidase [Ignavibacteriae bacterium]|nr:M14 family zinc carboxypeptidase [Ignavibacteriota bacterium]
MKKIFFSLLIFSIIFTVISFNISDSKESYADKYSKVKIYLNSANDIQTLLSKGITADEFWGNTKEGIVLVLNTYEMELLKTSGFRYDILIDDMNRFYESRNAPTEQELKKSFEIMHSDNIDAYTLGTMGGFHTFSEIVRILDTLTLLYPNIVSTKINLGSSQEARTIWGVKISDNPNVNESATEPGVYFDGIHHAREPMSMEVQLYYMYWLCENYGTNPEATYLINNREIFFVPCVNPDGYEYNRSTNPNGGGDWRKNRRNNVGSYGVDLNRNYSYGWGLDNGSSGVPSSDTYRGPSAFSEPETQAVRDFLLTRHPKIGLSIHSVAGEILNPYSYCDTAIRYDLYADLSSEFAPVNQYPYGTVKEMLDYYSSGTTRDFMHVTGTYGWTVEISGSDFWPASSEIIPLNNLNLPMMKYISWIAGAYPKMQNFTVAGKGSVYKNDTLQLKIAIRNKGLSQTSKNVIVELSTTYANATPLVTSVNYDSIQVKQIKENTNTPFKFKISNSANIGDNMQIVCTVKQEGAVASKDTFYVTIGYIETLFSDNAENGKGNWTVSGNGKLWDTTYISFWKGAKCFTDSRWGNSSNSTTNYFALNNSINLTGKTNPRIEYAAKWATEPGFDYARIQVSSNGGTTWVNLPGRYTKTLSSQPSYHGMSYWVYEQVNLNAYIGQTIKIRFNYYTDNGVPGDGFYFDDFRVVDYRITQMGITSNGTELPDRYALSQNYPNPFNPVTKINFDLPQNSFVKLNLFDILGREVSVLVNENLSAGKYTYELNATNLSSGAYFYKLETPKFSDVKRMIISK